MASPEHATLEAELRRDVERLSVTFGERNVHRYEPLVESADWLIASMRRAGYEVERQRYETGGRVLENIAVELRGRKLAHEIVVVGAHYDTVMGSPGANDNASGVALLLALARALAKHRPERTLRFVAFANEEMGFQRSDMGSWVYARRCRDRNEAVVAMISLETLGYYSDATGSQRYPDERLRGRYPDTGHFVAVVANEGSAALASRITGGFRRHSEMPIEGAALPADIPGVGWSDHWAFWQEGYPGVMITDTAPFRYPYHHSPEDTPDKLRFDRLVEVFLGLRGVLADLSG